MNPAGIGTLSGVTEVDTLLPDEETETVADEPTDDRLVIAGFVTVVGLLLICVLLILVAYFTR